MTKLVLETVSTSYDIKRDRIHTIETFRPMESGGEDDWDLHVDGIVSYARRQIWMSAQEFERNKPLWRIRGVKIFNAVGEEVKLDSPNPEAF